MNKSFVIIGAGGHAKVIIEIIEEMGERVTYIFDTNPLITILLGYKVTDQLIYDAPVIIAIGDNKIRKRIAGNDLLEFGIAIHPKTSISTRSKILEGTVIMSGVSINSDAQIGKHCIINTNASIDHDCRLGDFIHISPNAALGGNVTVGEGTHIGIGATVTQGIQIGKWAIIGAGSVIIEDVPDYAVVVGVPGKIIKYNNA